MVSEALTQSVTRPADWKQDKPLAYNKMNHCLGCGMAAAKGIRRLIQSLRTVEHNMKKLSKLVFGLVAAVSLTSQSQANTITLTDVAVGPGGAGSLWTYTVTYANSLLLPGPNSIQVGDFFTINDFGAGAVTIAPLPAGWVFSQAPTGPNSVAVADNPGVLNATFTWTGGPTPLPAGSFVFQLTSSAAPIVVAGRYTSLDHVLSGPFVGSESGTFGTVAVPAFPAPDGGMTMLLLGSALAGIGALRRKLSV